MELGSFLRIGLPCFWDAHIPCEKPALQPAAAMQKMQILKKFLQNGSNLHDSLLTFGT
jgi:hypothetical protein